MPTEVFMPALGMSQETGRLLAWLKNEGDTVERGDVIMEVETDKTTVEVEAQGSGTLINVTAQPGDDVPVGQVIALILAEGETAPPPPAKPKAEAAPQATSKNGTQNGASAVTTSAVSATPVAMRMAEAHGIDLSQINTDGKRITRADVEAFIDGQPAISSVDGRILASPKARRLAEEQGYALEDLVPGSGPGGAVITQDVMNFTPVIDAATVAKTAAPALNGAAQSSTMWRRMAERLTDSWQTVPHFYLKRQVSAENLLRWRKELLQRVDTKVTVTDLLVKVVAAALKSHPYVNGQWSGEAVIFNDEINVGLAVAVDEGLLVPVIHTADQLGMTGIATRRKEIVERAQIGKLKPDDLQRGTFTISNLGMFGIDEFSAIVNPPQAAILAVGTITEQFVPVNGEPTLRKMMTLSLSCDHRAVDGAHGARFLKTLAEYIEDPMAMLD